MFRKKNYDKRLDAFRSMPELYHTIPGKAYDMEHSEVLNWISKQPGLLEWLKDMARYKGLIEFVDGKWRGVRNERNA
ncbi:MAG: hypothetical protein J6D53_06860 [Blautia sp.]|nr:hypothetical protein [Blautia sp.]